MFKSIKELKALDQSRMLGEGAFSRVIKVLNKNDNKIYALKTINL